MAEPKLRSGDLIKRVAYDRDGQPLGRVADLVVEDGTDDDGQDEGDAGADELRTGPRLVEVMVTRGPWGRLFGYERPDDESSWLLAKLAHALLRRRVRELPWTDVRIDRRE